MRVDRYMREEVPNELCLLIVEDNNESRKSIRSLQNSSQDVSGLDRYGRYWGRYLPLRSIKEDPLFQPKRADSMLTVADFVAYVFKRQLNGDRRFAELTRVLRASLIPHYT